MTMLFKNSRFYFYLFSGLYLISFFIPSYQVPSYVFTLYSKYLITGDYYSELTGYECFLISLKTLVHSPIIIPGTLANFVVVLCWMISMGNHTEDYKIFNFLLRFTCIFSVLLWPVLLKEGFLTGYYLWAISSIGISVTYTNLNSIKKNSEVDLLDN
jgi:hypothetical protein